MRQKSCDTAHSAASRENAPAGKACCGQPGRRLRVPVGRLDTTLVVSAEEGSVGGFRELRVVPAARGEDPQNVGVAPPKEKLRSLPKESVTTWNDPCFMVSEEVSYSGHVQV